MKYKYTPSRFEILGFLTIGSLIIGSLITERYGSFLMYFSALIIYLVRYIDEELPRLEEVYRIANSRVQISITGNIDGQDIGDNYILHVSSDEVEIIGNSLLPYKDDTMFKISVKSYLIPDLTFDGDLKSKEFALTPITNEFISEEKYCFAPDVFDCSKLQCNECEHFKQD
jgi:hypothetical protein